MALKSQDKKGKRAAALPERTGEHEPPNSRGTGEIDCTSPCDNLNASTVIPQFSVPELPAP